MEGRDAEIEAALDNFVSADLPKAEDGFRKLWALTEPILKGRIRQCLNASDTDEALVDTMAKLWAIRTKFNPQGSAAWISYAKRTAMRCAYDIAKARLNTEENPEDFDILFCLSEAFEDPGFFDRLAAETWCGYDHRLPQRERNRRVTAAAYFFLQKRSIRNICESLLPGVPRAKAEAELESWLTDQAVLRDLARRRAYRTGYDLACHLLDMRPDRKQDCLKALLKQSEAPEPGDPPQGWEWREVPAIISRYQFGLSPARTKERTPHFSLKEISGIDDRCRAKFPFAKSVSDLAVAFKERKDLLKGNGVWYHLAYKYWYRDGLSQKDILQRMVDAADAGGKKLNAGQLNVWFGNHRLVKMMLATWEKRK